MTLRPRNTWFLPLVAMSLLQFACGPAPVPHGPAAGAGSASVAHGAGASPGGDDPLEVMERTVADAIEQARASAVALEYSAADAPGGARRVASGVVVGEAGEVISVRIDPPSAAMPIVARVASGRRLPARWLAADPETGLTLLRIESGAARPATAAPAKLGVPVLVIGNPFGLEHSVSRGFVAGLGRRLDLGPHQLGGLIQIDAALHPGDSGALLADLRGGWLGVIRSGLSAPDPGEDRERHDDDLGFAIPAADALWVAGQLRERGRVDRAYLGVSMDKSTTSASPENAGAVLGRVHADSPAEHAGLKPGDRVVSIDGQPVRTAFDLSDRLDRTPAEADVTLELIRGDGPSRQMRKLSLRSARRPPFTPPRAARTKEKSRPDDTRSRRELADTIDRLEKRVRELEKERREDAAVQLQPR